jgi:hypothetical protein
MNSDSLQNVRLLRDNPAHILEEYEEVHGVGRGGDEIKMFVEAPRIFILCMHGLGAYPCDLGGLQRALHGVPE